LSYDPEVLSRVRHLHLKARVLTDSLLMGEHRSRRVGQAVEFADYQEYRPGMDPRRLDWRVWARTDRYVVKRFLTETQLPCTVVLDMSADMSTGSKGIGGHPDLDTSKAGYAITLAATLLYWLYRHGEPVGLELVGGDGSTHIRLPPRGGRTHLQLIFLSLASVRPGGKANLKESLVYAGARLRRRSWVAVVTDGMESPEEWLPALGGFARQRTDLNFFHLYDEGEFNLDFSRPALFYSPEGGESLAVDPVGAQEAFEEVSAEYVAEVKSGVVRWGGRYIRANTRQPLELALRALVRPSGMTRMRA
jgi:uncharacterized protein (DUF58 family)